MRRINRFFLFFIAVNLFVLYGLSGQNKPIRAEIQVKDSDGDYQLLPSNKYGVLVYYKSLIRLEKNLANWHFSFYNSLLQEVWQKKIPLETNWQLVKAENIDSINYFYFTYATSFSNETPFVVLKINIIKGSYRTFSGSLPIKANINNFNVFQNHLLVSGINTPKNAQYCLQSFFSISLIPHFTGVTLIKIHPIIDFYDMKSQTDSIIYLNKLEKKSFMDNLYISDDNKNFYCVINDFIDKKTNNLQINKYNSGGEKINSFELKGEKKTKMLLSAKIFKINENCEIAIGTYDNSGTNYPTPSADAYRKEASGVFFAKLNENKELQNIKYYNFSELKSLLQSFGSKDSIRLDIKNKKLQNKGKEMSLNYQYLLHDIQFINNQMVFMLETYYPVYRTVYYTNFDYYGRPTTSSYTVFDGYKFVKALIIGFDLQGEMVWNHSFDIINIQSFTLKERVRILPDEGNILLLYASDGKIASKLINQGQVIENLNFTKIETNNDTDKVLSDYECFVEYWYQNYFISFGYQKVKKSSPSEKSKRSYFYFNKLSFE